MNPTILFDALARSTSALCRAARVGLAALACSGAAMHAADQPQWGARHSRNMASGEKGLPATFDPKTGKNIRWSVEIGSSCYSTPVIARGKVFIGTNNGNPRDPRHQGDRGILMCLDEATGRLLWQLVVPKQPRDPYLDCPGIGITSSAAVEEDHAYLVSNRGEVICVDIQGMANGNDGSQEESAHAAPPGVDPIPTTGLDADIEWIFDLRKEVGAYTHDSANISVLVHGPFLYVSTPNGVDYTHRHRPSPGAPGLVVLDKRTGRLVARDDTGIGPRVFHSTFSSASLGNAGGQDLVFYGGADGICYAFKALPFSTAPGLPAAPDAKGKTRILDVVWKFDTDPDAPKENISQYQGNRTLSPSSIVGMPVFDGGRIYVATGGDPWHGKRQAWLKCIDATQAGDITRKGARWSYPLQKHSISTPAVWNGMVFITDFGRMIHCIDAETGKPWWTEETDDEIWGSPLVADGRLYVGTRRGGFWIMAAGKEKRVLDNPSFGEPINGSPTAANSTIYVATMSRLYAIRSDR